MAFSVLILGSGSALPTLNSNQSAQIVEVQNSIFLIDCGEGTQLELRRNKVKVQKINHIFISHLHGDHFFGLVGLLSTLHLLGREKELHIYGPKGLDEIVKIQFRNAGSHLSFEMVFHLVEQGGECLFENKQVKITSLPLKHRIPCFGFLISEKPKPRRLKPEALAKYQVPTHARKGITEGKDYQAPNGEFVSNERLSMDPEASKSYAYCSDTAYYEKLLPWIKEVDLLYHESTFLEEDRQRAKKTYHSTAKDAASIAQLAQAKKLLLGHFSNRYKSKAGFVAEAREVFSESEAAEEGKRYRL